MQMTYDDFKKKMASFCEVRRIAWHEADWDADLKIEKSMDELEKKFPEFYDRWYNELLEAFKSDHGIKD
jgi:hypothetical protein